VTDVVQSIKSSCQWINGTGHRDAAHVWRTAKSDCADTLETAECLLIVGRPPA